MNKTLYIINALQRPLHYKDTVYEALKVYQFCSRVDKVLTDSELPGADYLFLTVVYEALAKVSNQACKGWPHFTTVVYLCHVCGILWAAGKRKKKNSSNLK